MRAPPIFFLILACLALAPTLQALIVERDVHGHGNIFGITFPGEGRDILLHQNRIASISVHDYVTAVFRVKEIVIDSHGASTVRIYYTRALTEEEMAGQFGSAVNQVPGANTAQPGLGGRTVEEAARRAANARTSIGSRTGERGEINLADTIVVKEYPATTHARSIEFRISDEAELLALYAALRDHWSNVEDPEADPPEGEAEPERLRLGGTQFIVER